MANQEQLVILKQNVKTWNQWRNENPDVEPDLSGSVLIGLNLFRANLSNTNLSAADLSKAFLGEANLIRANLTDANLSYAYLGGANLENANLQNANINGTVLDKANLKNTILEEPDKKDLRVTADYDMSDQAMLSKSDKGPQITTNAKIMKVEPEGYTYTVWYGTNRKPVDADDFTKGYSSKREQIGVVHYGKCDVHIPKYHKIGSLGSSWLKQLLSGKDQPLMILDRTALLEDAYWENIETITNNLEKGERTALIFIHGFNVSFDEAALRAAQLGVDLKVPLTAFYSWPSKGNVRDYAADAASVEASELYIKEFLLEFAKNSKADSINVIAHSMGNRALLRAVQQASESTSVSFNQIFLAAPDIDTDTFKQLASVYDKVSARTTLYCSSKDKALKASGFLYEFPRAGLVPPITIIDGIDTVEVANG